MKNLTPLRLNFSYFKKIINSKRGANKTTLLSLQIGVGKQFKKYVSSFNNDTLTNFTSTVFPSNIDELQGCYCDIKEVTNLKNDIYANQPNHIQYECQYCMIGDSGETFDHYLPQSVFPEFSVLSLNLIPCCSKCNSIKSTYWKDTTNTRGIINFYYDVIPSEQFINCTITFIRNTPIAEFNISNPGTITTYLFQIINNHFNRLELLDRFKKKVKHRDY